MLSICVRLESVAVSHATLPRGSPAAGLTDEAAAKAAAKIGRVAQVSQRGPDLSSRPLAIEGIDVLARKLP